jgi:FkbM family methyltransferase
MNIPIIQCPLDCLASFGEVFGGQYDWSGLDELLKRNAIYKPVVVDIGANVGAFAIWAADRWKSSEIYCIEPQPDIFEYLKENLFHLGNVSVINCAVGSKEACFVTRGRNRLCSSMNTFGDVKVAVASPSKATEIADIIKIDCEGGESEIVHNLHHIPYYLVLEYHSDALRLSCENALAGNMTLVGSSVLAPGIGILKFAKLN